MIDLDPIMVAAEEALKVRHYGELAEYAERGTESLNGFGWTRVTRLLIRLFPFTAKANPEVVLAMAREIRALRDDNARLKDRIRGGL